jgi:hypothetical protein
VLAVVYVVISNRRTRRLPAIVGGIRVEAESPRILEDRVVEAVWATPIILINRGRRPAGRRSSPSALNSSLAREPSSPASSSNSNISSAASPAR